MNIPWLNKVKESDIAKYNSSVDIIRYFGTATSEAGKEIEEIYQKEGFQILYRKKSYLRNTYNEIIGALFNVLEFDLNRFKNENNIVIVEDKSDLSNLLNIGQILFSFIEDSKWEKFYKDIKAEHLAGNNAINSEQSKTRQIVKSYFEGIETAEKFIDYYIWQQGIKLIRK